MPAAWPHNRLTWTTVRTRPLRTRHLGGYPTIEDSALGRLLAPGTKTRHASFAWEKLWKSDWTFRHQISDPFFLLCGMPTPAARETYQPSHPKSTQIQMIRIYSHDCCNGECPFLGEINWYHLEIHRVAILEFRCPDRSTHFPASARSGPKPFDDGLRAGHAPHSAWNMAVGNAH